VKLNVQTPVGVKQKTSKGHRKLCWEDMVLLYLMRKARKVPFELLRMFFGVSIGSAKSYFDEVGKAYHEHIVPLLLYPRSGDEIKAHTPEKLLKELPGCRMAFDATGLEAKAPSNSTLRRLVYGAYHHQHEGQFILGEKPDCV
jgi:hypothetical protein